MQKGFLLIDGNSVGNTQNNGGKLSIGSMPTQAIYGFLRALRAELALYAHLTPVVIWDGASWRKLRYPEYKENREKKETIHEKRAAALKDDWKRQAPHVQTALKLLGVTQVRALNMEADDLGAIMTDLYTAKGHSIVLWTGDKDWIQLVGPNVMWKDARDGGKRRINERNFEEMTGVKDARAFTEMKCLTGDSGDNVPGIGGIGDKGALEFLSTYGSFQNFLNMWTLEKSITDKEFKKLPKKYRDLVVDESKALKFALNLELMDLRTSKRPKPENMTVDRGEPDRAKFQRFCELLLFNSITKDLDGWLSVFPAYRQFEPIATAA